MQLMKEIFKLEYKESKVKTLLLRGFISWTLLLIVVTLGIQNTCNPIYKSQDWSRFTECKGTVVAKNFTSSSNTLPDTDKPVNQTSTYRNPNTGSDNTTKPVTPTPQYKSQNRGNNGINTKELIAITAAAAVAIPVAIAEAPALAVAGVGLGIWFVVSKSLNAIF